MDPDELAAVVLIQQEGDPVLLVIQCAKGSDRAGRQAQQLGQLLCPGKGKRPMPQPGFQRFQVGTLFSVQYQQPVKALLLVADQQILGDGVAVFQSLRVQLLHIEYSGVLRQCVVYFIFLQQPQDSVCHVIHRDLLLLGQRLQPPTMAQPAGFLCYCSMILPQSQGEAA